MDYEAKDQRTGSYTVYNTIRRESRWGSKRGLDGFQKESSWAQVRASSRGVQIKEGVFFCTDQILWAMGDENDL